LFTKLEFNFVLPSLVLSQNRSSKLNLLL